MPKAVRISDMDEGTSYIAGNEGDCHDFIDAMIFNRVMDGGVCITQGHTFGEPIFG